MAWSPPSLISTNANPRGSSGLPVHDELHLGHCPVLREQLPELVLGRRERHVAHVQILCHRMSLQNNWEKAASAVFGGRQNARRTEYSVPGAATNPTTILHERLMFVRPRSFPCIELNCNATRMAWPMHRPARCVPSQVPGMIGSLSVSPGNRSMRPFAITAAIFAGISLPQMETRAEPDFDKDVAALLARRCLECHSGADPKGDLDLTRKDAVTGKDGPVVPGKLEDSLLWETGGGRRDAAEEAARREGEGAAEGVDRRRREVGNRPDRPLRHHHRQPRRPRLVVACNRSRGRSFRNAAVRTRSTPSSGRS